MTHEDAGIFKGSSPFVPGKFLLLLPKNIYHRRICYENTHYFGQVGIKWVPCGQSKARGKVRAHIPQYAFSPQYSA